MKKTSNLKYEFSQEMGLSHRLQKNQVKNTSINICKKQKIITEERG